MWRGPWNVQKIMSTIFMWRTDAAPVYGENTLHVTLALKVLSNYFIAQGSFLKNNVEKSFLFNLKLSKFS